ncbi:MAG: hypothetical protein K6B65_00040 [Bacilli bacterium]|nr:hypothetical protein [Bacilli bacterium]
MTNLTRVYEGLKKNALNKAFLQAAEEINPSLDQVAYHDPRLESLDLLFRINVQGASL